MIKIGIDPDCNKSGVATKSPYWKGLPNGMEVKLMTFFELFEYLSEHWQGMEDELDIYIEAGWLNAKSNFHGKAGQTKAVGERIAKNVGANHETGRKIVEMCEYLGLKYTLVRPKSAKMKPEIFEKITGIKTRNQEKIDAAILIL